VELEREEIHEAQGEKRTAAAVAPARERQSCARARYTGCAIRKTAEEEKRGRGKGKRSEGNEKTSNRRSNNDGVRACVRRQREKEREGGKGKGKDAGGGETTEQLKGG